MKPIQHFLVYFSLLLAPLTGFAQFDIPDIPEHQTSVYDYAEMLDSIERYSLETKLLNYADTTSTQIVIATVKNLNGDSAQRVAPEWAQKWGIGQADNDNGVFILVGKEDRQIYIANGYGVQGRLTAGITGLIIREHILPYFKEERYYYGLDNGTDAIFLVLQGAFKAGEEDSKNPWIALMRLVLLLGGLCLGILLLWLILRLLPKVETGGGGYSGVNTGGGGYSGVKTGGRSYSGVKTGGITLPEVKPKPTTKKREFKGGFGGGGFSGGGAGGSW